MIFSSCFCQLLIPHRTLLAILHYRELMTQYCVCKFVFHQHFLHIILRSFRPNYDDNNLPMFFFSPITFLWLFCDNLPDQFPEILWKQLFISSNWGYLYWWRWERQASIGHEARCHEKFIKTWNCNDCMTQDNTSVAADILTPNFHQIQWIIQ